MNREHWKKMLPIITAFANGEEVEYNTRRSWKKLDDPDFKGTPEEYRIKPKPREWHLVVATKGNAYHKEGHVITQVEVREAGRPNSDDLWEYVTVREVL